MPKKSPPDSKTCESCESYKPVNPGDEAGYGYCYLMPPVWTETDGVGGWARPVVTPAETCRMWLQRLNS